MPLNQVSWKIIKKMLIVSIMEKRYIRETTVQHIFVEMKKCKATKTSQSYITMRQKKFSFLFPKFEILTSDVLMFCSKIEKNWKEMLKANGIC